MAEESINSAFDILYEDNHLIAVNKRAGEITQGDCTGDTPLPEKVKAYLKEKYHKPGNVYLGVVHRLDRPVSGIVIFAKTSKALSRMNEQFREDRVKKVYHAIVEQSPKQPSATLRNWLLKNQKQNKSYIVPEGTKGAKKAVLDYSTIGHSDRYTLLEVALKTGRHHQIRVQLGSVGAVIRGDLKYGAKRSLPNGSISLHARAVSFIHPVTKDVIEITAPYPKDDALWAFFESI